MLIQFYWYHLIICQCSISMDIPTDDKYNLSEIMNLLSSSEPDAGPLYDADEVYREVCDKEFLDSFGDEGKQY